MVDGNIFICFLGLACLFLKCKDLFQILINTVCAFFLPARLALGQEATLLISVANLHETDDSPMALPSTKFSAASE